MSLRSEALLAPTKRGTGIITGLSAQRRSLLRIASALAVAVIATAFVLQFIQL